MEDALEVVDVLADSELEGAVTWLVRLVGLAVLLGGVGLWLLTDMGLLVVPALLMVAGLVLLVAPSVLLALAESGRLCSTTLSSAAGRNPAVPKP